MALEIREIHRAAVREHLNEEWFLVENTGAGPINTAGCTLLLSSKGKKGRGRPIGSLDPGFTIKPGEKVRLVTGSPAKKGQGAPPVEGDGIRNYHLFLREPVLQEAGALVQLSLRQHELCAAVYQPDAPSGIAPA